MKILGISFILFFIISTFTAAEWKIERLHELNLKGKYLVEGGALGKRLDLSGLTTDGKSLYTVSDRKDLNDIYQLVLDSATGTAVLTTSVSMDSKWLKSYHKKFKDQGRIDFEGIAWCNGSFHVVDERNRSFLTVTENEVHWNEVPWGMFHSHKGIMNPFSGVSNSGLEAIACGVDDHSVFLFNERQFRMGYLYSMSEKKLLYQFDYPGGYELPAAFGNKVMYPDFAGAHYDGKNLWILERNNRQIVKYSPEARRVIVRYTFKKHTADLYDIDEPFGMAEGITIMNGMIYIILDNNNTSLKGRPGDTAPTLLMLHP